MMGLIGIIGWIIFFLIILAILWCLTPWWLIPSALGCGLLYFLFTFFYDLYIDHKQKKKRQKANKGKKQQQKINSQKNKRRKTSKANMTVPSTHLSPKQHSNKAGYDNNRAYREEEQAAYDDYIASLDMNDE